MKKIFLRIILVICCITVCNLIAVNSFTSKGAEVESYGLIIKILDESENLSDATAKIDETYNHDTLKKMCDDYREDLNNGTADDKISNYKESIKGDGVGPFPIGKIKSESLTRYLNALISEVVRADKFNEIQKYVYDTKKGNYSKESIEKLQNYKSDIKSKYTDDYYSGKKRQLGKTLWTRVTTYTDPTGKKNETDNLCEYIDDAIDELNKKKNNIVLGENETLPISISTDFYDPSQNTISDQSADWYLVKNKVGIILGYIRNISVIVAVIVLMIIGLKYILGSVEEKANYKETLLPYIIGIILVTSGTIIISAIYNIFN